MKESAKALWRECALHRTGQLLLLLRLLLGLLILMLGLLAPTALLLQQWRLCGTARHPHPTICWRSSNQADLWSTRRQMALSSQWGGSTSTTGGCVSER